MPTGIKETAGFGNIPNPAVHSPSIQQFSLYDPGAFVIDTEF